MVGLNKKKIFLLFVFVLSFLYPVIAGAVVCDSNLDGKSDQELQAISAQCDADLAVLNSNFENTKKSSSELEKGIAELNYNISKIKLEIKAKNAKIKQLGENIVVKNEYIGELSDRMENIKKSVAKMMRESYSFGSVSLVEIFLSNDSLSTFLKDVDDYSSINLKLQELTAELSDVKNLSEKEKKDLETKQTQEAKLKYEQEQAKKTTETYKAEKQDLLSITKNKEAEYKKLIAEKEKLKNQIRNKLFRTASGMEISFGDALKLIQPYESTIGVSSALVLSVLFQESAMDNIIGANIGRCTYNQSSPCLSGKTVMSDTQKDAYLKIMSNLELNPETSPVSCPICRDGNYGGAMGPSQFMPETWLGIAKRVSNILSISYPSPFNNLDAFTASAVLLKDNQDRCKTAFTKRSDIWACSASKYYGGLNLKGSKLTNFMYYGYGSSVLKRALQFEKDIETLSL
jgi:peptidoglycan hydrolase CwlO-like protein